MKKVNVLIMLFLALCLISCEKEEQSLETEFQTEDNNVKKLTHNYDYYGSKFSVSYYVNNDNDLLHVEGDLDDAERIMGHKVIEKLFVFIPTEDFNIVNVKLFDSKNSKTAFFKSKEVNFPSSKASDCTDSYSTSFRNLGVDFKFYDLEGCSSEF